MRPSVGFFLGLLISFSAVAQQKKVVFRTLPTQTTLLVDGKEMGTANNQKIILGFNERKGLISHEIVITAQGYVDEIFSIDSEAPRYMERTIRLERKLPRIAPENEFHIDFEKVVSGLEYSTNVGAQTRWKYRYDEQIDLTAKRSKVIDALERMGLNSVQPRGGDLFETNSETVEADVLIAGRVMRYDLYKASKGSWSGGYNYTSKARVKWQFFDRHTEEIIYEKEVLSSFEFSTSLINEEFFNSIIENFYTLFSGNRELIGVLRTYSIKIPEDTIELESDTAIHGVEATDSAYMPPAGVEPVFISRVGLFKSHEFSDIAENAANAVVSIWANSEQTGSGVVVSENGYIVTNDHIAHEDSTVEVKFSNGIRLPVVVVKRNPERDLLLLKVEINGLTPLPIVSPTAITTKGENVFFIGSDQSLHNGQSVSKGVIRSINDSTSTRTMQTNVSVGARESGGPVLNMKGEILGIVSHGFGRGTETDIAFVIPASYLRTGLGLTHE